MNTQSSLFSPLNDSQVKLVLKELLNTAPIEYRLLSGGLFNTTYFVHTAEYGNIILRIGPINRHLLLHFEHNMMEAEAIVYRLLAAHGIPSSELIAVDTSKTLIERDIMIVRHIPSTTYTLRREDSPFSLADTDRLYRILGENIAKLHQIEGPHFGHVYDVAKGVGTHRWSDFLKNELEQIITQSAPYKICTEQDHEDMREILHRYTPFLDEIDTPRLIHADLGPNNLLIRNDKTPPEFAAFIDTDRAMWGDPDFDFAYMEWMFCPSLWEGYGRALDDGEASVCRRLIYRMIRFLCNAYVWEVEYNNHPNMCSTVKEIRLIIRQLNEKK